MLTSMMGATAASSVLSAAKTEWTDAVVELTALQHHKVTVSLGFHAHVFASRSPAVSRPSQPPNSWLRRPHALQLHIGIMNHAARVNVTAVPH
ncbi:hypothetical protein FA95DRAFT_1603650 [Auriscalpium vulgare]|uniref:Uncharacterized protein n=1 Tax=Auriscalpium vulgare TaxID=40419 RepID=A0ACB8S1H3_9AGAM|nr:hypothetical protein FA95DRAFT_1603650 [Auriscalpium vulgare]